MPVERRHSIEGLSRCTTCRRHVAIGASPARTECPFCEERDVLRAPRTLRGMALAGLLGGGLTLAGCGGAATEPADPPSQATSAEAAEPATETSAESFDPEPADDPGAVDVYGGPMMAEEDPDDLAPDDEEEPGSEDDEFEDETPPPMAPVARYGRVPVRR